MIMQLFLASTPLHILNSVAIASQTLDKQSCLWLIDQPNVDDNPYFKLLSEWEASPFTDIRISKGHIKGPRVKVANRKIIFTELSKWVSENRPTEIFTGSDRRIEFQYAMSCAVKNEITDLVGVYMDEGTFTYVGRQPSTSFSDRVIDNLLKKLTYGFWWKNPETIGASAWINKVYAAFPNLVHPLLSKKQLLALQPIYDNNAKIKEFCTLLLSHFGADTKKVSNLNCILTLPHESIIAKLEDYKSSMKNIMTEIINKGGPVGVKYHPRNTNPDILDTEAHDTAYLIPYSIPFEAILPLLPTGATIIGDMSSTLINSRWLRPDAKIISIRNPDAPLANEFEEFFNLIGVKTFSASDFSGSEGSQ